MGKCCWLHKNVKVEELLKQTSKYVNNLIRLLIYEGAKDHSVIENPGILSFIEIMERAASV